MPPTPKDQKEHSLRNQYNSILAYFELVERKAQKAPVPALSQLASEILKYWKSTNAITKDSIRAMKQDRSRLNKELRKSPTVSKAVIHALKISPAYSSTKVPHEPTHRIKHRRKRSGTLTHKRRIKTSQTVKPTRHHSHVKSNKHTSAHKHRVSTTKSKITTVENTLTKSLKPDKSVTPTSLSKQFSSLLMENDKHLLTRLHTSKLPAEKLAEINQHVENLHLIYEKCAPLMDTLNEAERSKLSERLVTSDLLPKDKLQNLIEEIFHNHKQAADKKFLKLSSLNKSDKLSPALKKLFAFCEAEKNSLNELSALTKQAGVNPEVKQRVENYFQILIQNQLKRLFKFELADDLEEISQFIKYNSHHAAVKSLLNSYAGLYITDLISEQKTSLQKPEKEENHSTLALWKQASTPTTKAQAPQLLANQRSIANSKKTKNADLTQSAEINRIEDLLTENDIQFKMALYKAKKPDKKLAEINKHALKLDHIEKSLANLTHLDETNRSKFAKKMEASQYLQEDALSSLINEMYDKHKKSTEAAWLRAKQGNSKGLNAVLKRIFAFCMAEVNSFNELSTLCKQVAVKPQIREKCGNIFQNLLTDKYDRYLKNSVENNAEEIRLFFKQHGHDPAIKSLMTGSTAQHIHKILQEQKEESQFSWNTKPKVAKTKVLPSLHRLDSTKQAIVERANKNYQPKK